MDPLDSSRSSPPDDGCQERQILLPQLSSCHQPRVFRFKLLSTTPCLFIVSILRWPCPSRLSWSAFAPWYESNRASGNLSGSSGNRKIHHPRLSSAQWRTSRSSSLAIFAIETLSCLGSRGGWSQLRRVRESMSSC